MPWTKSTRSNNDLLNETGGGAERENAIETLFQAMRRGIFFLKKAIKKDGNLLIGDDRPPSTQTMSGYAGLCPIAHTDFYQFDVFYCVLQ